MPMTITLVVMDHNYDADAGEHRRGPSDGGGEEGGNVSCRGGQEGQQQ